MKTNSSGGVTLWLTGLSGSGKTTIGNMLTRFLEDELGIKCFNLDGDKVRTGLNKDLKFSKEDRAENIRRIAETSKLCNLEGLFVIVSCISPYA
jgi:adenylylsulfate kinase-like enzyme